MNADLEPVVTPLTEAEARHLTDQIRTAAERTWDLLFEAHERRAWESLGYETFVDYTAAEFGMGSSNAYRLLTQAMVLRALEAAAGFPRAGMAISARQAEDLEPQLVNAVRAVKRAVKEHPDEPPEKLVAAIVKRLTKRPAKEQPALTSGSEPAESSASEVEPAELPAPAPAPPVTTREHLRALALTPAVALAMINRTELRAVQAVISEALRIQDPHPSVSAGRSCEHPRNRREQLGYAIKCGACGDVVKR